MSVFANIYSIEKDGPQMTKGCLEPLGLSKRPVGSISGGYWMDNDGQYIAKGCLLTTLSYRFLLRHLIIRSILNHIIL